MKRFLLFAGMLSLIIGFAFLVGCSDDDDDNGTTGPVPGDPNDPQFQIASDIIGEGFLEHDNTILTLSLLLSLDVPQKSSPDWLAKPAAVAQFPDSLDYSYSYSNFWHVFTVYARYIETEMEVSDTLIYTGIDSLRFTFLGTPVESPDLATGMDIRAHFDADLSMSNGNALITTDASFGLTATPDTTLLLNGTSADTFDGYFQEADTACEVYMTSNQTATNVNIDLAFPECPLGGTINVNASLDVACMADTVPVEFSGAWTVLFVFNNGTSITVTYTSGNNYWTETIPCETAVKKRGVRGIMRRLYEQL
jgi:hypothetical protein